MERSRTFRWFFALGLALSVAAVAPPAGAAARGEGCDPIYGCQPTTTSTVQPGPEPECIVSLTTAVVGQQVSVTITNVPVGIQVDLLLNGAVVDSAIAGGSGVLGRSATVPGPRPKLAAPAAAATAAAGTGFVDVELAFIVPALTDGSYTLEDVGPAFRCECLPGQGFRVLSSQLGPGGPGGGGGGGGGGNLARTGVTIGVLLAAALALLLIGRYLQERSRRTRAAAQVAPRGRHGAAPEHHRSRPPR